MDFVVDLNTLRVESAKADKTLAPGPAVNSADSCAGAPQAAVKTAAAPPAAVKTVARKKAQSLGKTVAKAAGPRTGIVTKRGVPNTPHVPGPAVNSAKSSVLSQPEVHKGSRLHGTSTDPSLPTARAGELGLKNPTTRPSPPRHPSPNPPPTVVSQATSSEVAVSCQMGAAGSVESAPTWLVQTRKGKGKGKNRNKQALAPPAVPAGPSIPASQGKRLNRKERRQEQRRGKAKAPLSFSNGKQAQPTSDTSRPVAGSPAETATSSRQAARGGQAGAKRALNETLSPRGGHKRQRLDRSGRVESMSYARAASAHLCVAVTCERTGAIAKEVSDVVIKAIQKRIIDEALSPTMETPERQTPSFTAKPQYGSGALKLWCSDDYTLAWLKRTVPDLDIPAGTTLAVKGQSELQKQVRCGIVIPDDSGVYEDLNIAARTLWYQNPWIDIKKWVVIRSERQKACWFVVLGVPEDQIPTLMGAERRLSFGLGSVYIKFQGANGRFMCVPRGWDPATKQLVNAGVSNPPPINPEVSAADPAAAAVLATPINSTITAPLSGGEPDDIMLSPASGPAEDDFIEGDAFAGLQLEEDEEGPTQDGDPFVNL